jgi:hypothetical protein
MVVCLDLAASAENQTVDKVTHTIGFLLLLSNDFFGLLIGFIS